MSVALCPYCDEQVTLPEAPDPAAVVRCPLCMAEFELAVVLDSLPPRLELVSEPVAASVAAETKQGAFPDFDVADGGAESSDDEFQLAAEDGDRPTPFSLESDEEETGKKPSANRRRSRKKQKNPVIEMVKIAAGGAAGLTIAYIVLWWISPMFGKTPQDPVGVAPALSRVVPWIVPPQLRSAPSNANEGGSGFDASAADSSVAGVKRSTSDNRRQKRPGRARGQQPGNATSGGFAASVAQGDSGNPLGAGPPFGESVEPPADAASGLPGATGVAPSIPDIDVPDIGTPSLDPGLAELDASAGQDLVVGGSVVSPKMLADKLKKAQEQQAAWLDADADARPGLAVNAYVALSELAEAAAFSKREGAANATLGNVKQLVSGIASDADQVEAWSKLGARWISSPNRRNRGVLLLGVVREVSADDTFHQLRVNLQGGKAPAEISILSTEPFAEPVKEGALVLVLGAIIDDPALSLTGYTGADDQVVLLSEQAVMP